MKARDRREPASRLPDLRDLAPKLTKLARSERPVPLLYVEFAAQERLKGPAARMRAQQYKQATAAALKSSIGTILRKGDLAAAGAGGRWFIVVLSARTKDARAHRDDAGLGVAAERLRKTVQRELAQLQDGSKAHSLERLNVRCGWNVLEPAADPLEALRHAMRGAALVARIEEQRATVLAAVTHEIRTPLTAIIGFAERLREDGLDRSRRQRSLDIIIDESKRLHRLAEGLIDIGAWTAGSLHLSVAPMSLADLVSRAVQAIAERAASRQVRIALRGEATIAADQDRCRQIFINLLDNAVRHSPPGATVDVRIARRRSAVLVTVTDRGPGFAAKMRTQAGPAFRRGAGGQVGLGLSIARLLTEAHGGSLSIARGRHGMVSVTFPDSGTRPNKNPAGPNTRL